MKISVIIPTRNEEANIASALSRLRRTSDRARTEIIVADGHSRDRTAAMARATADKVIELAEPGRAAQMQAGALAASGDILLFLHADTRLPGDWQEQLAEVWSSRDGPVATAFKLGFDSREPFYRRLAWAANLRTALTGVPHGDQAIALRREVFLRVGGFPPAPLMEEYLLFKKLKALGPALILPGSVATSARRYEKNGRLFNALRNAALIALFYLGVPPRRLARLYR